MRAFGALLLLVAAKLIAASTTNSTEPVCLLPFCTETTTTTTDIITLATIVSIQTTLTISQPVVICVSQQNSTATLFTSTCTSPCSPTIPPSARFQVCKYENGPFRLLFNALLFIDAMAACEAFGWRPADLNYDDFNIAVNVARTCVGQSRRVWIRTYEGEAKPCLVMNTGNTGENQNPFIEVVPCDLRYPIICKLYDKKK